MNSELFLEPGINIQPQDRGLSGAVNLSPEILRQRWHTEKGQSILAQWKSSGFRRDTLDTLVGKYYDHTDLRGIPLAGEILHSVDITDIDFFYAHFEKTQFNSVNLTNSWLSESCIRGASFKWSTMDKVLIDNADFDAQTLFVGINLSTINFTMAALLQDLAFSQERVIHLKRRNPTLAAFLRLTCDYGRSFGRFFLCSTLVMILFGVLYEVIPGATNTSNFWNNIYFSVVTFTTLGYGDIYPVSALGKVIVVVEVSLGYLMLGLLVAIFTRRTIGR